MFLSKIDFSLKGEKIEGGGALNTPIFEAASVA